MDETVYRKWWDLHLRVARGEVLSAAERATYEAGQRELHTAETLPGDLDELRKARAAVASLEAEQSDLQERRRKLQAEIAALEAALDERARDLLTARD